ncbi:hypothetical protein [Legionella sp. CNM-4043-24]
MSFLSGIEELSGGERRVNIALIINHYNQKKYFYSLIPGAEDDS